MTTHETKASDTVRLEPIPEMIYWSDEGGNFYGQISRRGQGQEFFDKWFPRRGEFPTTAHEDDTALNTRPLSIPKGEEVERGVEWLKAEAKIQGVSEVNDLHIDGDAWEHVIQPMLAALSTKAPAQEQFAENANISPTCAEIAPVAPAQGDVERIVDALCSSAEPEWSFHEDDLSPPRDFWHLRLCLSDDLKTDWTSHGKQEQRELSEDEKRVAEAARRESLRRDLTAALASMSPTQTPEQKV